MNDTNIHPSSVIEEGAQIGAGCKIGPFCVIGPAVVLHDNVELKSHVVITGQTEWIGERCFSLPCWGKFRRTKNLAAKTKLIIGERNCIREHVTMNPGTEGVGV